MAEASGTVVAAVTLAFPGSSLTVDAGHAAGSNPSSATQS